MPISGLVIRIDAKQRQQICTALEQVSGVELQPVPTDDILVATLESRDFAEEATLTGRIAAVPGVANVSVAYHNFEDVVAGDSAESRCN